LATSACSLSTQVAPSAYIITALQANSSYRLSGSELYAEQLAWPKHETSIIQHDSRPPPKIARSALSMTR
jgi:hypothetical protein